jgi:hypothetical protein
VLAETLRQKCQCLSLSESWVTAQIRSPKCEDFSFIKKKSSLWKNEKVAPTFEWYKLALRRKEIDNSD